MSIELALNCETVRETFRAWNTERESLDSELNESLVALEAYQLHLDSWHQQLARERTQLQNDREQFERDRLVAEKHQSKTSAETITELHAAREKITSLTTLLLDRTEELRTLDNRRAEAHSQLELARAMERESKAALDDYKRSVDHERSQWANELKHLRAMAERQWPAPDVDEPTATMEQRPTETLTVPQASTPASNKSNPNGDGHELENPLVGSLAEQFGKLRQQRAVERQAHTRQR